MSAYKANSMEHSCSWQGHESIPSTVWLLGHWDNNIPNIFSKPPNNICFSALGLRVTEQLHHRWRPFSPLSPYWYSARVIQSVHFQILTPTCPSPSSTSPLTLLDLSRRFCDPSPELHRHLACRPPASATLHLNGRCELLWPTRSLGPWLWNTHYPQRFLWA